MCVSRTLAPAWWESRFVIFHVRPRREFNSALEIEHTNWFVFDFSLPRWNFRNLWRIFHSLSISRSFEKWKIDSVIVTHKKSEWNFLPMMMIMLRAQIPLTEVETTYTKCEAKRKKLAKNRSKLDRLENKFVEKWCENYHLSPLVSSLLEHTAHHHHQFIVEKASR